MNVGKHFLSPKLEVRAEPDKGGFGVYAIEAVAAGEVVSVWGGYIVDAEQLETLPHDVQQHSVQIEEGLYSATIGGAETRRLHQSFVRSQSGTARTDHAGGAARHRSGRRGVLRLCHDRLHALRRIRMPLRLGGLPRHGARRRLETAGTVGQVRRVTSRRICSAASIDWRRSKGW